MPCISAINKDVSSRTQSLNGTRWDYFKDLANMVCSRESTYRTGLDITGFDAPLMAADLFRGVKKFLETSIEALSGTVMVVISPVLTTWVGRFLGKYMLKDTNMKDDPLHYLRFSMAELRDQERFKIATDRLKNVEVQDKNFIASLYNRSNKKEKAEHYTREAQNIEQFCNNFEPSEEKRKLIYKLKKATIIGESLIEGGFWGGFGLVLRGFRKYILKEDRFTGTKGYVSDEESAQLGESEGLNWFQKIIGVGSIFVSPILNTVLLNKIEDREAVKNNKFLSMVDSQLDTTHGVYPKLGLLFTQTTVPKWISIVTLSQGWYERTERILKLLTVLPSWWMGHRITNGLLALNADKELAKKHNVEPGILVEPEYLKQPDENASLLERLDKRFPEPARIHHVMETTKNNEELQKEAEDSHAKCLYKGFGLHSLLIFAINLIVNHITKLRALKALGR